MAAIAGNAALAATAARQLNGEGWRQAAELALALVRSAATGLEREARQKNAGLRAHTLAGVGAALFILIGKYGFTGVLQPGVVVLDPSPGRRADRHRGRLPGRRADLRPP
jgi:hypothetical protein